MPNLVRIGRNVRKLFKLVNFKTAAGGHLLFLNFTISGRMHVAGATMNQIKFRKDRINGSKFRDFSFPYEMHYGYPKIGGFWWC